MSRYVLTDEAEADLRGVIRYAGQSWGEAQTRRYVGGLEQGKARLAAGEGGFRDMSALYPALRMALCGRHYVFCLPRAVGPALVVAMLHERMDLLVRLEERLNAKAI